MPDEVPQLDWIDYTSIRFPSDQLTIGAIRRIHPEDFDVDGHPDGLRGEQPESPGALLEQMIWNERVLARYTYEAAKGRYGLLECDGPADRQLLIEELSGYYLHFQLASGPQHALQLIRDIEEQARAQAIRSEPPLPPMR